MLSSLLRRPRSLRVPISNGNVEVRRVNVTSSRSGVLFFVPPLLAFCIIQTSDYWLPKEFRKTLNRVSDNYEKAKKNAESESNRKQFGEHWTKAHEKIAQTQLPKAIEPTRIPSEADKKELFLKIPIWTRPKHLPPYLPPDPEWKEFQKLQADEARVKELRQNVAKMTFKKFLKSTNFKQHLGFIDYTNEVGMDLEILIPFHPPAVYEIPGLSISPSGIKWTWQTLPESYGSKLQRVLNPSVFTQAFWAGLKVFCVVSWSHSVAFVHENVLPKSSAIRATRATKLMTKVNEDDRFRPESATEQKVTESKSDQASDKQDDSSALPVQSDAVIQAHRAFVGSITSETALKQAIEAFQARFLVLQIGAWQEMPRGACMIEGVVDFIGTRGKIRNQVHAIYIPSEDRFVGDVVIANSKLFPHTPAFTEDMMTANPLSKKKGLPRKLPGPTKANDEKNGQEEKGA